MAVTVSDISAASLEQSNGIDEMSHAVAHMDGMTQQNAALAEQSAASATALTDQIQRLNELVATFRTGQGETGGHGQRQISAQISGKLSVMNPSACASVPPRPSRPRGQSRNCAAPECSRPGIGPALRHGSGERGSPSHVRFGGFFQICPKPRHFVARM